MKKISIIAVLLLIFSMIFLGCGQGTAEMSSSLESSTPEQVKGSGQMKVAMAKVDITPKNDVHLDGYSGGDETFAKYPDDFTSNLMARILVIENDEKRTVYVNIENLNGYGISDEFRLNVALEAKTTTDSVIFNNTHNHQAMGELDYSQQRAIEKAVKSVCKRLVPVKIGVETYGTHFGVSRGSAYTVAINKPYDNTMTVVRFDNAETGEELGLIYSAPIHNTSFGVNSVANWKLLNCELCGYASRYMEEKYSKDENFTAMFISGFYGNSGPFFESKPQGSQHYAMTVDELQGYGEDMGKEVLACYEKIVAKEAVDWKISSLREETTLKRGPITAETEKYWGTVTEIPFKISAADFGNIAFYGVNYEPFSIIGARLRAESPYEYLIMGGNVDGCHGYIPTKETFHSTEYENECQAWKTSFDENTEEEFYAKSLDVLCRLKGVSYERKLSERSAKEQKDGKWVYTFEFAEEIAPDKIVVSFEQKSRLDCAADFVLELFDKSGNKTQTIEVEDNSVNYLGFFAEGKVAKAVLTVSSTYRSESPAEVPASVHAVLFSEIKK